MGKSSKSQKAKADQPTKKLGRRKQLQEQERQKEENERRADAALAAGIMKLAERGIAEDSDLFAPIPPSDDCAICMAALPLIHERGDPASTRWWVCCGQTICAACNMGSIEVLKKINAGREKKKQPALLRSCPFCRTPQWSSKGECLGQYMKRIELGDSHAAFSLACKYRDGDIFEKDSGKYFDHLLQAVELGSPEAMNSLSVEYSEYALTQGDMVTANTEKRRLYLEAAARGGNNLAHRSLGLIKRRNGNNDLAVKHYHVAAAAGDKWALDKIQLMHKGGRASKDDFLQAILAYQDASAEHSTEERKKWEEKLRKAHEEKTKKTEETRKKKEDTKPKPPTGKKNRRGRGRGRRR